MIELSPFYERACMSRLPAAAGNLIIKKGLFPVVSTLVWCSGSVYNSAFFPTVICVQGTSITTQWLPVQFLFDSYILSQYLRWNTFSAGE